MPGAVGNPLAEVPACAVAAPIIKLVTLLCKPSRGPGLALGPLEAPEYESRLNSRSRVPLSTFYCRFYQLRWWSPVEVHWTVHVDCPRGQIQTV
jgi:hypothetical protein